MTVYANMERIRKQLEIDRIFTNDNKVTIAVLDSGIDGKHPDLNGTLIGFRDFVNGRKIPYDDYGHGTHVCGCIAGSGLKSKGKYQGIVKGAYLVVGKVLDEKGDGMVSHLVNAIYWIINTKNYFHTKILNISIGTTVSYQKEDFDEIHEALNAAWKDGILVVCAAGNGGPANSTISAIGRNRNIITVGCHEGKLEGDYNRSCQFYSGRGTDFYYDRKPDLVAPGTDITSCKASTFKRDRNLEQFYCKKSGTSMATAIVSGCCGLFFQQYPQESNEYCKRKLLLTAKDLGEPWNLQGYGMIQPQKFILT